MMLPPNATATAVGAVPKSKEDADRASRIARRRGKDKEYSAALDRMKRKDLAKKGKSKRPQVGPQESDVTRAERYSRRRGRMKPGSRGDDVKWGKPGKKDWGNMSEKEFAKIGSTPGGKAALGLKDFEVALRRGAKFDDLKKMRGRAKDLGIQIGGKVDEYLAQNFGLGVNEDWVKQGVGKGMINKDPHTGKVGAAMSDINKSKDKRRYDGNKAGFGKADWFHDMSEIDKKSGKRVDKYSKTLMRGLIGKARSQGTEVGGWIKDRYGVKNKKGGRGGFEGSLPGPGFPGFHQDPVRGPKPGRGSKPEKGPKGTNTGFGGFGQGPMRNVEQLGKNIASKAAANLGMFF